MSTVDLAALPDVVWSTWLQGWQDGRTEGLTAGDWQDGYRAGYIDGLAETRAASEAAHAEAFKVVQGIADRMGRGLPPPEQELSPQAAEKRRQAGVDAFRADHARRRAGGDR